MGAELCELPLAAISHYCYEQGKQLTALFAWWSCPFCYPSMPLYPSSLSILHVFFFFLLILIIVNSETCKKRWKLHQSARAKATCAARTQGMTGHLAESSVRGRAGAWGWGAVFSGMPPRFACDRDSGWSWNCVWWGALQMPPIGINHLELLFAFFIVL